MRGHRPRTGITISSASRGAEVARPKLPAARVPTPGPWIVHATAQEVATAATDVTPTGEERAGSFTYALHQDRALTGGAPLHLAGGIPRLADATLMAAAPDLAAAMLTLLTSPDLMRRDLDAGTRTAITVAWDLLVRVAPHLEI